MLPNETGNFSMGCIFKVAGRCDISLPVSTSSRGEAGNRGQYEEHGVSVF